MLSRLICALAGSLLARVAAAAALALLALVSLLPRDVVVRTGAPGGLEHITAYALTAMSILLSFPTTKWILVAVALSVYGAWLELAQKWIPGRTSELVGLLSNCIGSCIGSSATATLLNKVLPR